MKTKSQSEDTAASPGGEHVDPPRPLSAPVSMDLSITGRCNLSCRYCFYADEMVSRDDLTTEEWKLAFEKLGEARVMRVVLTGGEVFTRPDLFQLIDSLIANRMRYSILTNGTLIDEETADSFMKGKRALRLDSVQVSVDGSTAEVHDRSRPGSFHGAVRGLELLKDRGLPVTARVTVSKHNMDDLEGISRLLLDRLELPAFSICDASPIGTGCTFERELVLDHRDTLKAGLKMEELLERYPGRITASAGPLARLRAYRAMETARRTGKLADGWRMGCFSACGGVFENAAVLHDGSVVPCSMLHDLRMGSILTDDLLDLWRNSPVMNALRRRYRLPLSTVPECSDCPWVEYCNGSCPGIVQQMQGTFLRPDWRACYRDFLLENGISSIFQATGDEPGDAQR
ncbi:MAG: radical SAM protein [Candidatus Aegiribacteria sp.]